MIRFNGRFRVVHTSASGRKTSLHLGRLLILGGCGVIAFVAAVSALSLYVPVVHGLSGDRIIGRPKPKYVARKVWADLSAAPVNALLADGPPSESAIPTVKVFLQREAFDVLNYRIREYGFGQMQSKPRVRGVVGIDDVPYRSARIGYRGTNSWHHQHWRPSLSIRFRKKRLVDGYREFSLIAPEDVTGLRNWLSTDLGRTWGMLSTEEQFVRLFVNRRFMGHYSLVRDLDESLLINQGRLPGPFFRLESMSGAVFDRIPRTWSKPEDWEIEGMERLPGMDLIGRLIAATREVRSRPTARNVEAVGRLIDSDSTSRWLALLAHSGEVHVGADHNQAFWFDTTTGRFVPVLIDVNGYGHIFESFDMVSRPVVKRNVEILDAWIRDPRHLALYADRLHELVTTFGSAEAVRSRVEAAWAKVRPHAMADLHASGIVSQPLMLTRTLAPLTGLDDNVENLCRFVRERNDFILARLAEARVGVVSETDSEFEICVEGIAGCRVLRRGDGPDRGRTLLTTVSAEVREDVPAAYAFHRLPGRPGEYRFLNRLLGDEIVPGDAPENLETLRRFAGLGEATFPEPDRRPVRLGPGEVVLRETREYAAGQPVFIEPGTALRLGPGVSLVVRGPLTVGGTADRLVTIRRLRADRPFGALALIGPGTEGSRIRHLDMEGGSIDRFQNLHLLGMFNIHDCPGASIGNSRFAGNAVGDDAVHVVRSTVTIEDCLFENTLSDAVDLDRTDGTVRGCEFRNTGNDGLDVSMGRVDVRDCRFFNCGDKGVSAGEGTRVSARGLRFVGCVIGVAIKDTSELDLTGGRFESCGTGLSMYEKKWRWGRGGTGWVRDCSFAGSTGQDIWGDAKSRLNLLRPLDPGTRVGGELEIRVRREGEWPTPAREER